MIYVAVEHDIVMGVFEGDPADFERARAHCAADKAAWYAECEKNAADCRAAIGDYPRYKHAGKGSRKRHDAARATWCDARDAWYAERGIALFGKRKHENLENYFEEYNLKPVDYEVA